MRLLLDTHIWLWMHGAAERLSPPVREMLANLENERYLSVASMWEIVIKHASGKLTLPQPPAAFIPEGMLAAQTTPLPIDASHVLRISDLPRYHRDPFDRVLIAQAQVEQLTIVTADPAFAKYDVEIVKP